MELIEPFEISAKILTLLEESKERVIIVSPYVKISKWHKLMHRINALKSRGIPIILYVRDDPENMATYKDLDQLELKYERIPFLHCKFYMNEKRGIITSMNLLISSEINSLEIGYVTENRQEYIELLDFYHKHIYGNHHIPKEEPTGNLGTGQRGEIQYICDNLRASGMNAWPWLDRSTLHIWSGHLDFTITINDGKLCIVTKLPRTSSRGIAKKLSNLTEMKVEVLAGVSPGDIKLTGEAPGTLESICINEIHESDLPHITETIQKFIKVSHSYM